MFRVIIYIFCTLSTLNTLTQSSSLSSNLSLAQRWKKASKLDNFQQTTKQYPFLIQNIKLKKFINYIDLGICQFMQGDPGRYLILDNQVYLYGGQKQYQRTQHYQKYLQRVIKTYKIPDTYLLVHIYDALFPTLVKQQAIQRCRQIPMFLFNKNLSEYVTSTKFLLPDNYITIDKWPKMIQQVKNVSLLYKWKDKIPKLFYRGACTGTFKFDYSIIPQPVTRQVVLKYCQRCGYAVLSYQHPDLIDAKLTTKCIHNVSIQKYILKKYGQQNLYGDFLEFTQQGKYRYLLYADGAANSWRRAASFMFSSSVLFMPFSQNVQWFYQHMIPDVNFMLVSDDLSDLLIKMKQLQDNQTKALQLVQNANVLAQNHLTFQAMANFTAQQITKYAKIQNLVLNQQQKNDIKRGIDAQLILKFKVMRQQWEAFNQYVSFEKIIKNFPKIRNNIQISKIIQIHDVDCKNGLAGFIILENEVYCQGYYCSSLIAKNIYKLIKKALQNYIIPDLYFLIGVDKENSFPQKKNQNFSQICKDLPYFLLSKDRYSEEQKNKFLFPYFDFQSWQSEINELKKKKKIDWNQKENKTYFGGIIDESYDSVNKSWRFTFAKLLTNIINSKKQYFQPQIQKNQYLSHEISNINQKYKYLLVANGIDIKYRKLQSLAMLSRMMVLLPKPKRVSWFDEIMIPGKHYIQINQNLTNLKYTIQLLIENDEKIKQLCQEAFILASIEFQGNQIYKSIIKVLNSYSLIQKLELTAEQKKQFVKGTPFNKIILQQKQYSNYYFDIILILFVFSVLAYLAYQKIIEKIPQGESIYKINSHDPYRI